MKKKIFLVLMTGMMVITLPSQVMAEEVDDRIAEIKKEISELEEELEILTAQKAENTVIEENKYTVNHEYRRF